MKKKYFFDLMSMNKNKIDYFFENKDILEHKIYRFSMKKKRKRRWNSIKIHKLINNALNWNNFENELKQIWSNR